MNPLHIQELVDRCIDFLDAADPALRACSLVSRSWVHPSQARIFSEIEFEDIRGLDEVLHPRASRLLGILDAAPHLTRYIKKLEISNRALASQDDFVRFSKLPFTRLASLQISHLDIVLDSEVSTAIDWMLRLPTVRALSLRCRFADKKQFLSMWEHCSSNIKHLHLHCVYDDPGVPAVEQGSPVRRHITLDSFHMDDTVQWWLNDPRCTLDFSRLRALRYFGDSTDILLHGTLAATFKAVEVLCLTSPMTDLSVRSTDLSLFERVNDLHLVWHSFSSFRVVPTIRPYSRVHLRILRFHFIGTTMVEKFSVLCAKLHEALSGLDLKDQYPNLALVHISAKVATPALTQGIEGYFPLLEPRISVRWNFRTDQGAPWYQSIV
ncbi:hypothetical protein B0H17DRAFT_1336562 [Mycena rosella]|uniref:Uncharacterized protein n=1 Tax=Mycena rosella TaxID=1033263 RepID=A0AAD7CVP1_MYCRO|nr:hypothetical protein B0H17DRAFT_1336562 [Mycena rosella]